jgi:glutamate synthase domain-containing protein 2
VTAAEAGVEILVVSDAALGMDRLPVPSILAAGAVHTALTDAGLRGRTDIVVDAADILDVHAMAMVLAVGATAAHPRLAIAMAAELAGRVGRRPSARARPSATCSRRSRPVLRKTLARMGISAVASYIGGALVDTIDLAPEVMARCFPTAAAWPGRTTFADLGSRSIRRRDAALALPPTPAGREPRLPDPGFARFRADGEAHLFSPSIAKEIQVLSGSLGDGEAGTGSTAAGIDPALARYRAALARDAGAPSVPRDELRIVASRSPLRLDEVEDARSIARRFVVSAMSVGALSPEAHQALTIGIQRAGGAANTGEGGEDPAWYVPDADGNRRDARIKQVASARFGVTATYLARADQLEIKISQGSKPGEGGQLPGRKATAYIAALRRGQAGQSYISPPPHHDIYSIEDLAQLIADLRAINPAARIGVKLVASRGVGTIAAGVAKAGATYIHLSGHAGGTGASPAVLDQARRGALGARARPRSTRSSCATTCATASHCVPTAACRPVATCSWPPSWAPRSSRSGRRRSCRSAATWPASAISTPVRRASPPSARTCAAKFTGTPEMVERFFLAVAEDLRRELAAVGARSVGSIIGESRRTLRPIGAAREELAPVVGRAVLGRRRGPPRGPRPCRPAPCVTPRRPARGPRRRGVPRPGAGDRGRAAPDHGRPLVRCRPDRALGARRAARTGPPRAARGGRPVVRRVRRTRRRLTLVGQANDYVGKGLSGGRVTIVPEPELAAEPAGEAIAGNTLLYGATAGRLHLVGRAGMRFAVRNSGATAVVEGIGPHGCEYMTGGTVVVLGPVGANFGAGMTGGRAYLYDPSGRHVAALNATSVSATRLSAILHEREDGPGSATRSCASCSRITGRWVPVWPNGCSRSDDLPGAIWVVEPWRSPRRRRMACPRRPRPRPQRRRPSARLTLVAQPRSAWARWNRSWPMSRPPGELVALGAAFTMDADPPTGLGGNRRP